MVTWPVFDVSLGAFDGHPEVAAFVADTASLAKPFSGMSTDCRHWCFPGAVLEARTHRLYCLLAKGCIEAAPKLFC